jgi:SAM-dependent methyltransferase
VDIHSIMATDSNLKSNPDEHSAAGGTAAAPPAGSAPSTWDHVSCSYDAERAHDLIYQVCLAATARVVDALKPRRLLDAGCGTGLTTLPLCVGQRSIAAVDYSLASLTVLRGKKGAPPAVQADLRQLPFRSNSFDVVMCANALQHLHPAQQRLAVLELQRVVVPDGFLVVTVHHLSNAKRRAGWVKEGRPGQPGIDYIFRFSYDDLKRLLPGARISAMGIDEWPRLPFSVQRRLPGTVVGSFLGKRHYGHMLLAIQQQ